MAAGAEVAGQQWPLVLEYIDAAIGYRMWLDLGLALDVALRVAGVCAKLRGIIP